MCSCVCFRIGLCGFENPMRSPKTDEVKRQIGQVSQIARITNVFHAPNVKWKSLFLTKRRSTTLILSSHFVNLDAWKISHRQLNDKKTCLCVCWFGRFLFRLLVNKCLFTLVKLIANNKLTAIKNNINQNVSSPKGGKEKKRNRFESKIMLHFCKSNFSWYHWLYTRMQWIFFLYFK